MPRRNYHSVTKLTVNVTHSKRHKPKTSGWDVTHMPVMTALEILLLSNTSIRYQIKINNCSPVVVRTETQSDACAQVEESRVSTAIDIPKIIPNHSDFVITSHQA